MKRIQQLIEALEGPEGVRGTFPTGSLSVSVLDAKELLAELKSLARPEERPRGNVESDAVEALRIWVTAFDSDDFFAESAAKSNAVKVLAAYAVSPRREQG